MFTSKDIGRRVKDGDFTGFIANFSVGGNRPVMVQFDDSETGFYTADGRGWYDEEPTLEAVGGPQVDMFDVMRWVVDRGQTFAGAIKVDGRLYYTDSDTDMEELYRLYRLERGE